MSENFMLNKDNNIFSDIKLSFCGYEACESLQSYGPVARPNYIIHYVLSGKGKYHLGEKVYELHEGEGFLIEPQKLTFYQADEQDPWTYVWVGFEGKAVEKLLAGAGVGNGKVIYSCTQKEEIKNTVLRMLQKKKYSASNELYLLSQLLYFFSLIAEETESKYPSHPERENYYIRAAIEYIQKNYYNKISVVNMAEYAGINRCYLSTLFQKEMHLSPKQYLVQLRLTRAAEMLKNTRFSVEEIAASCGYQDPEVFSKAFKLKYKLTPSQYRKK